MYSFEEILKNNRRRSRANGGSAPRRGSTDAPRSRGRGGRGRGRGLSVTRLPTPWEIGMAIQCDSLADIVPDRMPAAPCVRLRDSVPPLAPASTPMTECTQAPAEPVIHRNVKESLSSMSPVPTLLVPKEEPKAVSIAQEAETVMASPVKQPGAPRPRLRRRRTSTAVPPLSCFMMSVNDTERQQGTTAQQKDQAAQLFIDKYRPSSPQEFLDNQKACKTLSQYLSSYRCDQVATNQAALVTGPVGCGKTTMVRAMLEHNGFDVSYICPASKCIRPGASLVSLVADCVQMNSIFSNKSGIRRKKAVVIDDFDSLCSISSTVSKAIANIDAKREANAPRHDIDSMVNGDDNDDNGDDFAEKSAAVAAAEARRSTKLVDIPALMRYIDSDMPVVAPIIFICSQSKEMRELKPHCKNIPLYAVKQDTLFSRLMQIVRAERHELQLEEQHLRAISPEVKTLAMQANGDIRKAVTSLELFLVNVKSSLKKRALSQQQSQGDDGDFVSCAKADPFLDSFVGAELLLNGTLDNKSFISLARTEDMDVITRIAEDDHQMSNMVWWNYLNMMDKASRFVMTDNALPPDNLATLFGCLTMDAVAAVADDLSTADVLKARASHQSECASMLTASTAMVNRRLHMTRNPGHEVHMEALRRDIETGKRQGRTRLNDPIMRDLHATYDRIANMDKRLALPGNKLWRDNVFSQYRSDNGQMRKLVERVGNTKAFPLQMTFPDMMKTDAKKNAQAVLLERRQLLQKFTQDQRMCPDTLFCLQTIKHCLVQMYIDKNSAAEKLAFITQLIVAYQLTESDILALYTHESAMDTDERRESATDTDERRESIKKQMSIRYGIMNKRKTPELNEHLYLSAKDFMKQFKAARKTHQQKQQQLENEQSSTPQLIRVPSLSELQQANKNNNNNNKKNNNRRTKRTQTEMLSEEDVLLLVAERQHEYRQLAKKPRK